MTHTFHYKAARIEVSLVAALLLPTSIASPSHGMLCCVGLHGTYSIGVIDGLGLWQVVVIRLWQHYDGGAILVFRIPSHFLNDSDPLKIAAGL
jgi:hypothetical protein